MARGVGSAEHEKLREEVRARIRKVAEEHLMRVAPRLNARQLETLGRDPRAMDEFVRAVGLERAAKLLELSAKESAAGSTKDKGR